MSVNTVFIVKYHYYCVGSRLHLSQDVPQVGVGVGGVDTGLPVNKHGNQICFTLKGFKKKKKSFLFLIYWCFNLTSVHRQQEFRDRGNQTLGLGRGVDVWWERGVVGGGLMVKQRGARIPWLCALCPADLALFHLMERSILSSPIRPSDLAGFLSTCLDIIWYTVGKKTSWHHIHPITEPRSGALCCSTWLRLFMSEKPP